MELIGSRIHRSPGNHPVENPLPSYADTRFDAPPPSYDYVTGLEINSVHKSCLSQDSMSSQLPGSTNTVFIVRLPDVEDTTRPVSSRSQSAAEHNRCTCIFLTSAGTVTGLLLAWVLGSKVF